MILSGVLETNCKVLYEQLASNMNIMVNLVAVKFNSLFDDCTNAGGHCGTAQTH